HFNNRAIGSLVESARLEKRGQARRALRYRTNCYGMARQQSSQLDDKYAFFGIHLARYLRSKQSHRLGTKAEIDMIGDLIEEYWHALRSSYELGRLNPAQKRMLFRETPVVFPFFSVPDELAQRTESRELPVDFHRGVRLKASDRCSCGSGLPFRLCHGRIPGLDELVSG
ncbi:MAG: SEC-C metal-binding domain-containing protein, partial [Spirochaetales bacterium]